MGVKSICLCLLALVYASSATGEVQDDGRERALSSKADETLATARELLRQRRFNEAETASNTALSVLAQAKVSSNPAHGLLGEVYLEQGLCEQAVKEFTICYNPRHSSLRLQVSFSLAFARMGQEQAQQLLGQYIAGREDDRVTQPFCDYDLMPGYQTLKATEAFDLLLRGADPAIQPVDGQADLLAGYRLVPENVGANFLLGSNYLALKDPLSARKFLKFAVEHGHGKMLAKARQRLADCERLLANGGS